VNIVAEDLTIKASDHAAKMQAFCKNQNGEEKSTGHKLGHLVECKGLDTRKEKGEEI
jgi:hypothetical protein